MPLVLAVVGWKDRARGRDDLRLGGEAETVRVEVGVRGQVTLNPNGGRL